MTDGAFATGMVIPLLPVTRDAQLASGSETRHDRFGVTAIAPDMRVGGRCVGGPHGGRGRIGMTGAARLIGAVVLVVTRSAVSDTRVRLERHRGGVAGDALQRGMSRVLEL